MALTAVCSAIVLGLARLGAAEPSRWPRCCPAWRPSWWRAWSSPPPRPGCSTEPLRTLLPPLAILLPGAILVTGLSEIAAGAMVAGVSRVGYGIVQLLLFALGILAAAALLRVPPEALSNIRVDTSAGGRRRWDCCWSASGCA